MRAHLGFQKKRQEIQIINLNKEHWTPIQDCKNKMGNPIKQVDFKIKEEIQRSIRNKEYLRES